MSGNSATRLLTLLLLNVAACDPEVTVQAGGGAGGASAGGGGGSSPSGCSALSLAGERVVLASTLSYLDGSTMSGSRDGELFAAFVQPNNQAQDRFQVYRLPASWAAAWPPAVPAGFELDLSSSVSAPGRAQGVSLLAYGAELYEDVVAELPQPVELGGPSQAHALLVGEAQTIAAVSDGISDDDEFRFRLVGVDPSGELLWERNAVGCGGNTLYHHANPAIIARPLGGGYLIAAGETPPGDLCLPADFNELPNQTRLIVLPTDQQGQGQVREIEDVAGEPVSSVGFVRREDGPLLVFARAQPPNGLHEHNMYVVPLDWSGNVLGDARALGMRQISEHFAVVEVDGGFVVASFPFLEEIDDARVAAALFDPDGNLLQEIDSEPLPVHSRAGLHAVAAPDGRSVIVGWVQETGDEATEGYGEPTLLRFDCTHP